MNGRTILVGLLGLVGLVILSIILVALFSPDSQSSKSSESYFSNIQFGSAGNYVYSIFRYSGQGNISAFTYSLKPSKNIYVLLDDQAIQATKFSQFVNLSKAFFEPYGFNVSVSNSSVSNDGFYIVPTGAMPSSVLSSIVRNRSNFQVVYFGQSDLIIANGLKRSNWLDSLSSSQKQKLVVINSTLDDFVDKNNYSIFESILENSWSVKNSSTVYVLGSGLQTIVVPMNNSSFVRLIYNFPNSKGVIDSDSFFAPSKEELIPSPQSIFPWEKSNLEFLLNRTNGTANLSIHHNGNLVSTEELRRVTDQNVFIRKLQFNESGDYIFGISDNSGLFASGILHVKNLSVTYRESRGVSYIFDVYLDGEKLSDSKASVWIGNSSNKKDFFVTNGTLIVNAALPKGANTFNIDLYGSKSQIVVLNNSESIFDFYLKFGIPGLALVVVVYLGARLSRRPTYKLRFGEGVPYVREEVRSNSNDLMAAFKRSRIDFNLGKSPINQHEFAVSIRKYVTKGADITGGNLESIVKSLVKSGKLESYHDYYQLPNEGPIKYNYLKRRIRDSLIEQGLEFDEKGNKFICTDFEVGFFSDKFSKRAIVVFDDKVEIKETLSSLSSSERSKIEVKISNGLIKLVSIDEFGDVL